MKKKIILAILAVTLLYAAYWVYGHSFIEITVNNTKSSEQLTFSFQKQGDDKASEAKSNSKTIKKLVSKSDYEVLVKQSDSSNLTIVRTNGFLRSTAINVNLTKEKERNFVGDNPADCVGYIESKIVSYSCGGLYGDINIHVPATQSQPTYALNNPNLTASGTVEGIVNTDEGNVLLLKSPENRDEGFILPAGHFAHIVDENLKSLTVTRLEGLSADKTYSIKPHGGGFIVFDSKFEQILYYPSTKSKPETISLGALKEKGLLPYALGISDNDLAGLYSTRQDSKDDRSEVTIKSQNSTRNFVFKKSYSAVQPCGANKLCLLGNDKRLEVFDTSGEKPKFLFAVNNVVAIENSQKGSLAVNSTGVLNLNTEDRTGYYEYTFGKYTFNDIYKTQQGYILRITSNKNRGAALLIDQNSVNTDSIDKKTGDLQEMSEVSLVSIYGKFIYISADLGELVYSNELRSFIYNPDTQKSVANKLNLEIDRLGIKREVYSISSNAF